MRKKEISYKFITFLIPIGKLELEGNDGIWNPKMFKFFQVVKGYICFITHDRASENMELFWPQYKQVKFNLTKSQVGANKSEVAWGT